MTAKRTRRIGYLKNPAHCQVLLKTVFYVLQTFGILKKFLWRFVLLLLCFCFFLAYGCIPVNIPLHRYWLFRFALF